MVDCVCSCAVFTMCSQMPTTEIPATVTAWAACFAELTRQEPLQGLAEPLARHVLEGEQAAVTDALRHPEVGRLLLRGLSLGPATPQAVPPALAVLPAAARRRWLQLLARAHEVGFPRAAWVDLPRWLEALLFWLGGGTPEYYTGVDSRRGLLPFPLLEAWAQDEALDLLTLACFPFQPPASYSEVWLQAAVVRLPGFGAAAARAAEAVRPLLLPKDPDQRLRVLNALAALDGEALAPFVDALVASGCATDRRVRTAATPLLERPGATVVIAATERLADTAEPEVRVHALRLAMRRAGTALPEVAAQLRARAAADRAERVRKLLVEWDRADAAAAARPAVSVTLNWGAALDAEALAALGRLRAALNAAIGKVNDWRRQRHVECGGKFALTLIDECSEDQFATLLAAIQNPDPAGLRTPLRGDLEASMLWPVLAPLALEPAIPLPALLQTVAAFGMLTYRDGTLHGQLALALEARHRQLGEPDLLTLAEALAALGLTRRQVMLAMIRRWPKLGQTWAPAARLPFFASWVDEFVGCLTPSTLGHDTIDRAAVHAVVAALTPLPEVVYQRVLELAVGSVKAERGPAQAVLEARADLWPRVIALLADGKAEVRAAAAQWLGRVRHGPAVSALAQAVRREKQEAAKGAMLDALQRLGQPISAYLDREALRADARKLLAKPLPEELAWLDFGRLPVVHWADDGQPVDADVLRALIVGACRQKSPEPNAILRKHAELFAPREREAFGLALLEAWIAADSRPAAEAVIQRQAQRNAQSMYQHHQRTAAPDDPIRQRTLEQWELRYRLEFAKEPVGTEIASKGVLAVVAACGGAGVAAPVARYLKDYYGLRAAQCKALIAMLAWVEHPTAVQLMLGIGKRFRTKGIQEEAQRQAELLAERKDWTLAELADRTIPTAGLDDHGVLELPYGARTFRAQLLPDPKAGLKLELRDAADKVLAALPDPRADDDAELAAAAKKQLAAARKEIKTVLDQQTQRLHEAWCTGRLWRFEDVERDLFRHPLMGTLVQRLVWCTADGLGFRPLADGSLSDLDDAPLALGPDVRVRIAHDLWLTPAVSAAWQQHLRDYAVLPLFPQLGKGRYTPEDDSALALRTGNGVVMDAFTLRSRVTKLGYVRGPVQDGPSFNTYEQSLPTLGLTVELEFTGNSMPEENRKVALVELRVLRAGRDGAPAQTLPLGEVPPVLLAECFHELSTLAAAGVHDPAWAR